MSANPIDAMATAARVQTEQKLAAAAARDAGARRKYSDAARAEIPTVPLHAAELDRVETTLASPTLDGIAAYDLWVALCSVRSAHARLEQVLGRCAPEQASLFARDGAA